MKKINNQIKIILVILFFTSLLNGCAELNTEFDCPKKPGINCEMLDEVNDRINRGEIGTDTSTVSCKSCMTCKSCPKNSNEVRTFPASTTVWKDSYISRKPLRYGETVQRVWMAPYEDTAGNYHQESEVFTVVKPGHWIGNPVKAVNENEE